MRTIMTWTPKIKHGKSVPLMNRIKEKCLGHFVPLENLSYDESMIRYYGLHNCKQFIHVKPIRFGYKMWYLNTSDGYLVNFDLYQGKHPHGNESYGALFGKSSSPLVLMLEELPEKNLSYSIHIDNLFTGLDLLSYLKHLGYNGIGTIRDNRISKSCPLVNKQEFAKKERGAIQHVLDKNDGIILVRWKDNAVVTMASTIAGVSPMGNVRRYSQQEKRHIQVNRPFCIEQYNNHMMDQSVAAYRINIRSKKWY
ncbi:hypothetical protein NQ314_013611 [Rhamnusium bicolor]|uniref:PiggyBac transposable element-derived protein domain-containing protein n=1 Tax=Rhamnusium bicolor TaxID=1586634 RepID=A0AAV8X5Q6_9CUCU|nr:hypothetical protein NQ314_013611 [Rhamnusium bicolor]